MRACQLFKVDYYKTIAKLNIQTIVHQRDTIMNV